MTAENYGAVPELEKSEKSASAEEEAQIVQNEYVLNVAFWTFIIFTIAEAFFAVIAGSQSMFEDAEAMSVDALTYLFNLLAEKVKHRPYSEEEQMMFPGLRDFRRERLRLYLELIPPLISVVTLIVVTAFALRDAFESLTNEDEDSEDDVDVSIMMFFSILNMLLDIVNVNCFARANQAFGLSEVAKEHRVSPSPNSLYYHDLQHLAGRDSLLSQDIETTEESEHSVNLNMCSAWTHVIADTLRSLAVLVAASIAFFVDGVSGATADSIAAIVVSFIILISLLPLLHGLFVTGKKIIRLRKSNFGVE